MLHLTPRLVSLFILLFLPAARAAEPFFKKGDVIALVGGEDMVVASEYGYLELLLTRALPDYHLRFRNLAWEGDTVFEQRRDLNFPTWEEQLDKIGATVVIAQFGQMESLAGKEKLPEFIAAYEKLIERFSGGGKRRVVIATPTVAVDFSPEMRTAGDYITAIVGFVHRRGLRVIVGEMTDNVTPLAFKADKVHLTQEGHAHIAFGFADTFDVGYMHQGSRGMSRFAGIIESQANEPLRQIIIAKNRLWFDYWRPQNWAFLAGDRTAQPSSRDHLDPSKRWFPPEREAFLPLIEAKEKEIDALAAQLAAGK